MRRDFNNPVPTYKLMGYIANLRTGEGWLYLATVIDLRTRMVVGRYLSDRTTSPQRTWNPRSRAARGRKRHFSFRQRRPVHQQDPGRVGMGKRSAPFLQPHRQLPRQCRGQTVLRRSEERDALQVELRHHSRRQARGNRVHRGRLRPKKVPLYNRLPSAGADYGIILQADQADQRAASPWPHNPSSFHVRILAQINAEHIFLTSLVDSSRQNQVSLLS